ncbi:DUF3829 domain-containing protein [Apibacter raozihei]|uniref:DUF3829 domain-containing protein n=1 Tax=Apibacter raozihei TaxID=2500547 RepID=UPI000FE32766|nr:DUF3829 domain-containing protein [Apibacter raozihei]
MRKILVLVLALSAVAVNTSCKKEINKIGNTVLKSNLSDANAIIDFNNNFLDSYKSSTDNIESILKYSQAAETKAKGGRVLIMPMVINIRDFNISKIKEIPSGFGKDKDAIEKDFNTYKAKIESIRKKSEELKSYINAEDYKDDSGAKAERLNKEIEAEAQAFYIVGESIITKIKPATDLAEEEILKDHPMKKYIISSKGIINLLDSTMEILEKQYTGGFNESVAKNKYDELEKAVGNNEKLDFNVTDSQYSSKKTQFESVNTKARNFLDNYRKLIRNSKETGTISDGDIRSLDSSYESVLSSYNSFVK